MNYLDTDVSISKKIQIINHLKEVRLADIRNEIITGLQAPEKYISSKFFYNKKGSMLFEEITRLKEYYPTRTEKEILKKMAPYFMNQAYEEFIELGSGDSSKAHIFMENLSADQLKNFTYKPIDVSYSALLKSAKNLHGDFPDLAIEAYVTDFTSNLKLVKRLKPALFCFLGSTIGNFEPEMIVQLLKNIGQNMQKSDVFLLGIDLVKPHRILHDAYNDAQGVTATFNKNILQSVNKFLETSLDENDFEHYAFFNETKSRIEMHLISKKDILIRSPFLHLPIEIKKREHIHTENSYKFSFSSIAEFQHQSNLKIKNMYTDEKKWFALVEFTR